MRSSSNKYLYNRILQKISRISSESLLARSVELDLALLTLDRDKALDYQKKFGIIPGYNKFFSSLIFLKDDDKGVKELTIDDLSVISKYIDKMIINMSKKKGILTINAIAYAQVEWQRKYIFKSYLFYLLLQDNSFMLEYQKFNSLNDLEISSICLMNKFCAEPCIYQFLQKRGVSISDFISKYIDYLVENIDYIVIEQETYCKEQKQKIIENNYNIFSARMLCKDYPIIKLHNGAYAVSSLFYIQNAIISRSIYKLADKGKNSKIIGEAFEKILYDEFVNSYSRCDLGDDDSKNIICNPKQSGNELCDVLIRYKGEYLLIDSKAKEYIETLYGSNNKELEKMKETYNQRFKRINDIANGKFSNYINSSVNKEDIYSLIAVVDDCLYSKNELIKEEFSDIQDKDKDYCLKHFDFITFDDLIELITSDVDLIDVMKNAIRSNEYINPLVTNVLSTDKSLYNKKFDEWYEKSINETIDLFGRILDLK